MKWTLAIMVLTLLGGCRVQQTANVHYSLPDHFSAADWQPDSPFSAPEPPDELAALIEKALQQNFDLKAAQSRVDQFLALAEKAGASKWPQLDAQLTGVHSQAPDMDDSTRYTLRGLASYEVDFWGKLKHDRQAAQQDLATERANWQEAQLSLAASITQTYSRIQVQRAIETQLQDQIQTNRQLLELVELRFRQGLTSAADVLRQKQSVEVRQGQLLQAQETQQILIHQLAVLVGEPPSQFQCPETPMAHLLEPFPSLAVPAETLGGRPDVQAAWSDFRAADARAASAFAARFPKLTLSAEATGSGTKLSDLFDLNMRNLTANLLAPLWRGKALKAEAERTQAVAQQKFYVFHQTSLNALREVEDALVYERYQTQILASLKRQNELAGQAYERIKDQYLNGGSDYINVLTSLSSRQDLERALISQEGVLLNNRIGLYRALGARWTTFSPMEAP